MAITTNSVGTYYDAPTDEYVIDSGSGLLRIPATMMKQNLLNPPWARPSTAQAVNKNPVPTNLGSVVENEMYRSKLVAMRLRLREGESMPFQFFATTLAGDKVFVFVVQDGQAVVLDDNAAMFPSDTLITQLRLLEK